MSESRHHEGKKSELDKNSLTLPPCCILLRSWKFWFVLCALVLMSPIALGAGLGVGLRLRQNRDADPLRAPRPTLNSSPDVSSSNTTAGTFWRPAVRTSWQIVLHKKLGNSSPDVVAYDIDLFLNDESVIWNLQKVESRRVICYFSAGWYEDNQPDSSQFRDGDRGNRLEDAPEYWLNTNSRNVRAIMKKRLELAMKKGCDGVDPDNVNPFNYDNGLNLSKADAVNYLTFLINEAHELNLSIGLKNAGALVPDLLGLVEWGIIEECIKYDECDSFQPFIKAGKPVFHIEYPDSGERNITAGFKQTYCESPHTAGFSTVLKKWELNDWVFAC